MVIGPGVTIKKVESSIIIDQEEYQLIDLPGIYGLNESNAEEVISKNVLLNEKIDLIINVLDVTNLERNLYLTLNLRELQIPIIVTLNFSDLLSEEINIQSLSNLLNCPVLLTSASKKQNLLEIINLIPETISKGIKGGFFHVYFGGRLEEEIVRLVNNFVLNSQINQLNLVKYIIDALNNDKKALEYLNNIGINTLELDNVRKKLERDYQERIYNIFQLERYKMVATITKNSINIAGISKTRLKATKALDKIFLNKYLGLPLFLLIIVVFLSAVFNGSAPLIDWLEEVVEFAKKYIGALFAWAPDWLQSLIKNGLIGGIGGVIAFIPLIFLIFILMAFFEESGYINRITFLLDRLFKSIGISGKSFIPLMLGFGCNVPAIYSLRALEEQKAKKITLFMIPFMSCGARIPVYVLIGAMFFGPKIGFVIMSLYIFGILIAIIIAATLNKFIYRCEESSNLIIELPPYHLPSFKLVIKKAYNEVKSYLRKATGIIATVLIILWFLTYFPNGDIETSFISIIAKRLSPIFIPLGFGKSWELVASLPGAIVAKETIVGFLSQLNIHSNNVEMINYNFFSDLIILFENLFIALGKGLKDFVTFDFINSFKPSLINSDNNILLLLGNDGRQTLRAYCFLIYVLLSIPCIATLSVIKNEFGKKVFFQVIITNFLISYFITAITYAIGLLILK